MDLGSSNLGSSSSSCSWAVISDDQSEDASVPNVCSVCGSELQETLFLRPSCDICVLCQVCRGLDFSKLPLCIHQRSSEDHSCLADMCSRTMLDDASTKQSNTSTEQFETILLSGELSNSSERINSLSKATDQQLASEPLDSSSSIKTSLPNEDHSMRIGEGSRSLTKHIIEALQHSSPPTAMPGSFSTMTSGVVSPTTRISVQGLPYSSPAMNLPKRGSCSSRSDSPSPVSFTGHESAASPTSPSCNTVPRQSSLPESPDLGGLPPSSPVTNRSKSNATMQFLKSVMLHSSATLNNFDLMPLDSFNAPARSNPSAKNGVPMTSSQKAVQPILKQNPIFSHVKMWDDEKLRAIIAPKPVPKAVSEAAAYNLR